MCECSTFQSDSYINSLFIFIVLFRHHQKSTTIVVVEIKSGASPLGPLNVLLLLFLPFEPAKYVHPCKGASADVSNSESGWD